MAIPTWPFSCPRSWSEKPVTGVIRSEVDNGFPKVRRRFTKAYKTIDVTFQMDWADKQAVTDFFENDLADGSLPFYITDPFLQSTLLVRWKDAPALNGSVDMKPVFQYSGTLEQVL
jgi:hypothetical protein